MKYVNLQKFENIQLETEPFDHVVIDNFMKEEYIHKFLEELEKLTPEQSYYNGNPNIENTKKAFKNNLGEFIDSIFKELCSDEFIQIIEKLTGITNIIRNNVELEGAGIHKVYNGGFLTMHKDFNHTYDKDHGLINRRINLLLYMNPEWQDEFKGHLCLYDENKQQIVKKILPILNRCVIFNTIDSIHGHPEPMNLPENTCRQSLALYYYTKNTTGVAVNGKELLPVQWYFDIK